MIKRLLGLGITLALCCQLLIFFAPQAAAEETLPLYLALGDSITTGYGLADADTESFPALVSKRLGFSLINEAVNGNTAGEVLDGLQSGQLDDEIANASLITLTCGGNDLVQALYAEIAVVHNAQYGTVYTGQDVMGALEGIDPVLDRKTFAGALAKTLDDFVTSSAFLQTLEAYEENMFGSEGIVSYIRARNESVPLIILTQYNPYKGLMGILLGGNAAIDQGIRALNEIIFCHARTGDYAVSDVYTAFDRSVSDLCNASLIPLNPDFHPNAAGHGVIAGCVEQTYGMFCFGFAGYQTGANGIRLVGYADTSAYDCMQWQVDITEQDGQTRSLVLPVMQMSRTLMGNIDGKITAAVSCDPTVQAPCILAHTYLFAAGLNIPQAGNYTVTICPVAYKGNTVIRGHTALLSLYVSQRGEISVDM